MPPVLTPGSIQDFGDADISTEAATRATADNLRVLKAGDTMTGALVLPGDPASALQASPKQYVDARVTQVITNGVTTTAPSEDAVFDALALKASTAYADAKVADTAYDATAWDGVTAIAPSKNSVRDEVETILTAIAAKAPLVSPALTGSPTTPTQTALDNSTKIASTAYADAKVADVINDATTGIAPSQNAVFDALALKAPLASPTFTGVPATPALSVSGLTGATNTGRFVGFVSGAAPTSGTFLAKDWVFDNSLGCQWLCTVGGTPGTWVRAGASGMELGYAEVTNFSAVALTGSLADAAGLSTAVTVGTRPIFGTAYMPSWVVSWSAAGARNQIVVMEDGVVIATANSPGKSAASGSSIDAGSVSLPFRRAPAAGSHTYKVQARTLGSTSGNYTSGATFPAYITVVER